MSRTVQRLCKLKRVIEASHNTLTQWSFYVAIVALSYLALVLSWEVLARYLLQKPSGWAPDTAALSFGFAIFLAAPMLSWKGEHANMNAIILALPATFAQWLRRFTLLLAAVVCAVAAYFGYLEFFRVYKRGVMMIAITPMPKWWLMLIIVYALISMSLHYLRHFIDSFFSSNLKQNIKER